jgi:hypothetical protein
MFWFLAQGALDQFEPLGRLPLLAIDLGTLQYQFSLVGLHA